MGIRVESFLLDILIKDTDSNHVIRPEVKLVINEPTNKNKLQRF
ncbi:hypothetical protein YDYSY3_60660 [Paenibacillus chitinolyticus]|nr:hypothetical protein [Paenibacillus chitinolyticus]GKS15066.1 hypothetical protein YDYSY3_60660 [Paenibacillus chitinolyticus]